MKELIGELLAQKEFEVKPPVLIDIGASGSIHEEWRELASNSICLAFDADDREFQSKEITDKGFKKLFLFNCIVSGELDSDLSQKDFYLTHSPYCSSLLEPETKKLESWVFADLFQVESVKKLNVRSLPGILKELDVTYVDWFKTDSQGTDLRLFKSLDKHLLEAITIAQFEPGIINAYRGEDKLFKVIEYMETLPFWMEHMEVKGTQRLKFTNAQENVPFIQYTTGHKFMKTSPCWAEISYINTFEHNPEKRNLYMGIIISLVRNQYGFALDLSILGCESYPESVIFKKCKHSLIHYFETLNAEEKKLPKKTFLNKLKKVIKDVLGL